MAYETDDLGSQSMGVKKKLLKIVWREGCLNNYNKLWNSISSKFIRIVCILYYTRGVITATLFTTPIFFLQLQITVRPSVCI